MQSKRIRAIVETLKAEILRGAYGSSAKRFPGERALALRFGTSRNTIGLILQELSVMGFLVRKQGCGTFLTTTARKLGRSIGLIMPSLVHGEIFPGICNEINCCAQMKGLTVVLGDVSSDDPVARAKQASEVAKMFIAQEVGGVIFQPLAFLKEQESVSCNILAAFDEARIPVVLIDRDIVPLSASLARDFVGIDNFYAGREMAKHLLASGVTRIAFVMRPKCPSVIGDRLEGVRSVAGFPCSENVTVWELDPGDAAAVRRALGGRKSLRRPEAFVCECDKVAVSLQATLRELGYSIPNDFLLAGFDDVTLAKCATPRLTSIHQPIPELGRVAFDTLLQRIADPSLPPRKILLPASLVVRRSTQRQDLTRPRKSRLDGHPASSGRKAVH